MLLSPSSPFVPLSLAPINGRLVVRRDPARTCAGADQLSRSWDGPRITRMGRCSAVNRKGRPWPRRSGTAALSAATARDSGHTTPQGRAGKQRRLPDGMTADRDHNRSQIHIGRCAPNAAPPARPVMASPPHGFSTRSGAAATHRAARSEREEDATAGREGTVAQGHAQAERRRCGAFVLGASALAVPRIRLQGGGSLYIEAFPTSPLILSPFN